VPPFSGAKEIALSDPGHVGKLSRHPDVGRSGRYVGLLPDHTASSPSLRNKVTNHSRKFMFKKALLVVALTAPLCIHAQTKSSSSGNITTALTQLDAFVTQSMQKTKVPGLAVAVVYKGQVVFIRGYGVRKLGDPAKVDPNTVFEIASVSKPIASTILASLVGTGEVSWDDRIEALDPGFELSNPVATKQVTIRDLFSHRSGLPTGAGDVLEDLGYSRPEILRQIRLVPLAGQFRQTYHYSNFGLTEGAIAAALKTGKTWEELAQERLYSRIGMHSTSSRYSDYENNPDKAALHYLQDGVYRNWFVREADSEAPAGGVSSNVRDLAKWMQLQLNGGAFEGQQVVDRKALEETHKGQICASVPGPVAPGQCPRDFYYGLGWNVVHDAEGRLTLSHSGAFDMGTATAVYLLPSEQVGIVALSNANPIGLPEAVCLSFLDFFRYGQTKNDYLVTLKPVFDALSRETQDASPDYSKLPPPQNASPARQLSAYTGTYVSPYYGKLQIDVERNHLILRLPPRGAYYELTHWNGDTFTYYFASENTGVARRGVKFLDGGKQVLVENLAIVNNGVFTKIN
jgi:CubicO group peptidase (beta-lactamase class C family)